MTSQVVSERHATGAGSRIQQPGRALISGLGVWMVGALLTIVGLRVLPADVGASATYLSFSWMVLATVIVAMAVGYLRRVGTSSRTEGILVGALWVATFVALDLVHYAVMHPAALGGYLTTRIPTYLPVPMITALVLGWLRGR